MENSIGEASKEGSWFQEVARLAGDRRFAGFYAVTLCIGAAMSFILPFISLWAQREVGMSPLEFGAYLIASTSSGIALAFVFGWLSDAQIERRTMLATACVSGALGYAGFALATTRAELVGVGVTLTAAASVCFSQVFAAAREWFDGLASPAVTVSIVRIGFSIAGTAGAPIGALIASRFGFTGLFLAASGLYAFAFLGAILWLPRARAIPRALPVATASLRSTMRNARSVQWFCALTLTLGAFSAATINMPLYLDDAFGGSLLVIGALFGVSPLIEVPLMLWFGALAARGATALLLRIGGSASVLYFISLFCATELWHVWAAQILNGVSYAILSNVAIAALQNLMPSQPGVATAVFANAGSAGKLLGYIGFGVLTHSFGPRGLFPACIACAAIGCALLFRLTRPQRGNAAVQIESL